MQKRSTVTRQKPSAVSRTEARKAVLGVKSARTSRSSSGKSSEAGASFVERYLGHFGVGAISAASKRGTSARKAGVAKKGSVARKSSSSKKGAAKKAASRSFKRAS